jgi:hypothetical protein
MSLNSRGNCITAYSAPFARGAKIYIAQTSGFLTGVASAAITPGFIQNNAVTTVKILSANVTKEKIGANAVRAEKISAGSVTSAKIRAAFISGVYNVSGGTTLAVAHGLSVKPKFVVVAPLLSRVQAVTASTKPNGIFLAAASAATSTNFYIIGNILNMKYVAYVQL